jgi:hypothetical protein
LYRIEIPGPDGNSVIVPNIIPVSKTMALTDSHQQRMAVAASLMDVLVDFGLHTTK